MEITESYVRDFIKRKFPQQNPTIKAIREVSSAMRKYENKWWESEDPLELAANQIFDDCLLVPVSTYMQGATELLGRDVIDIELFLFNDKIQEEARQALSRLEREITKISPEEAQQKFGDSVRRLEEYLGGLGFKEAEDGICIRSVQSIDIPISDKERKILDSIKGSGGKQSWIEFDNYKSLLDETARVAGISYPEIVKSRKNELTEALNHAFAEIKSPDKPCANTYEIFGVPRDRVLAAFGNEDFYGAARILQNNFGTYML